MPARAFPEKPGRFICMPFPPHSSAARRCTSDKGWATQSQAGLLRSVLSIIVSSRDEKVACCWLDVGFIGASERGGRANPASQHVERGDGGAARMLGSAAP